MDASITTGVDPHTTLVIYMGLSTLPSLTRQLAAAGLSLDTPAVAVERGTTAQQRSVYAELGALQEQVGRLYGLGGFGMLGSLGALVVCWVACVRACGFHVVVGALEVHQGLDRDWYGRRLQAGGLRGISASGRCVEVYKAKVPSELPLYWP